MVMTQLPAKSCQNLEGIKKKGTRYRNEKAAPQFKRTNTVLSGFFSVTENDQEKRAKPLVKQSLYMARKQIIRDVSFKGCVQEMTVQL